MDAVGFDLDRLRRLRPASAIAYSISPWRMRESGKIANPVNRGLKSPKLYELLSACLISSLLKVVCSK